MVSRLFLVYVLVELAAVLALASTIGLGWTLLVVLAAFVVGAAVAGSQIKRQLIRLRAELTSGATRLRGPLTDGALVALAALLVAVPGLVTTAVGLLLLLPPTRAVARPLLTVLAARSLGRPLLTVTTVGARRSQADVQGDVIDGEVIDVTDVEPLALPKPE
ncbi:MAG: FxsA family protein [Mycobacterium sp.]